MANQFERIFFLFFSGKSFWSNHPIKMEVKPIPVKCLFSATHAKPWNLSLPQMGILNFPSFHHSFTPSPLSSRLIAHNYHSNLGVLCHLHSLELSLADHLKIWHGEACEGSVGLIPDRTERNRSLRFAKSGSLAWESKNACRLSTCFL